MTLQIALTLPGSSTAPTSSAATLPPAVIDGFICRCSRVLLLCRWILLHLGSGYVGPGAIHPARRRLDHLAILARGGLRRRRRACRGRSSGFGARLGRRGRARGCGRLWSRADSEVHVCAWLDWCACNDTWLDDPACGDTIARK